MTKNTTGLDSKAICFQRFITVIPFTRSTMVSHIL